MMHKDLNFHLLKAVAVQGLEYFFFLFVLLNFGWGRIKCLYFHHIAYQAHFHFFLLNEVKSLLTFAELSVYDCFL